MCSTLVICHPNVKIWNQIVLITSSLHAKYLLKGIFELC